MNDIICHTHYKFLALWSDGFSKKSQDDIYFSSSTSGPRTLVVAMVHFLKCQKLTYDKFRFFLCWQPHHSVIVVFYSVTSPISAFIGVIFVNPCAAFETEILFNVVFTRYVKNDTLDPAKEWVNVTIICTY